jgi:hypothetical protein
MYDDGARPPPRAWPGALMFVLLGVFGGVAVVPLEVGLARAGYEVEWGVLFTGLGAVVGVASLAVSIKHMRAQPKPWYASALLQPGVPGTLTVSPAPAEALAIWLENDLRFEPRASTSYEVRLALEVVDGAERSARRIGFDWHVGRVSEATSGAFSAWLSPPAGTTSPELGLDVTYGRGRYRSNVRLCTVPPSRAGALSLHVLVEPLPWAQAAHLRIFASPA